MKLTGQELLQAYKKMLEIRCFEEATIELYKEGTMPGLAHPYIGQEAMAVGVCLGLNKDDYIVSNHRGHGHLIAKGGDLRYMMAEILGRKTGYCKGKGGSMHIADFSLGILGANGIVGGGFPISVGAALSAQKRGSGQISVCFFGDASTNQGSFHEALNLASVWKLPVVFVCENNGYGISVSQAKHQNIKDIADRAVSYGIEGVIVDGNDVEAVYQAFGEAAKKARAGEGPTLIEGKTYRWTGHHVGDPGNGIAYRSREEMESWKNKCPLLRAEKKMLKTGLLSPEEVEEIKAEIRAKVAEAVIFAKNSPFPAPQEVTEDVFA